MKNTTWNILTVLVLLATCLMAVMVIQIYSHPDSALNPFRAPGLTATVVIPSATPTLRQLPPTWTFTPLSPAQASNGRSSTTSQPGQAAYGHSVMPSLTPTLTAVPSFTPRAPGTPRPYDCVLTDQLPPNGSNFNPGAEFYATWTIENIGWNSLVASDVDYRYLNGTHLQQQKDAYDLPQTLMRSSSISLVVPMLAPTAPGNYAATWAIISAKKVICSWTIQVNVISPTGTPPG
ncbi:MAG TPA: NBR1-Ig-like domain-containing protein [Anaerolineaceae bacterium]|nr:NBR1-Ig-like domain-containing protein [Anaerolineaceae bacterium]